MSARKENRDDTTWESAGALTSPNRGTTEEQLEHLKMRLLAPLLTANDNPLLIQELRWAANEAAALAWFTICPMLVLPALLDEKISTALQRWERQQSLRRRSASTKEVAAATSLCRFNSPVVMAA